MEAKSGKSSWRLEAWRLAEEADEGFVRLAQSLMRLFTWRRASGDGQNDPGPPPADRIPPLYPEAAADLAERVERIVERCSAQKQNESGRQSEADPDPVLERTLRLSLKELFHQEAGHRLAAVRWIRQRRLSQALPALEGVLAIEESQLVREEILRTLRELKINSQIEPGGIRCSG